MNIRRMAALAVLPLLVGCATAQVSTDYNPAADFSGYHTFSWIAEAPQVNDIRLQSGLAATRIRTAVETVLEEKGFEMVASGGDFEVGWLASAEDRVQYSTFNSMYGRGRYGAYWQQTTTAHEYTEGTLVIDIFDAGTEELVWRGIGEGKARFDLEPEEAQARAITVLREILADFPPS
jgi:hypothetical protein